MKKRTYTDKQKKDLSRNSLKWYYRNREKALASQAKYRARKLDEEEPIKVRNPLPLFGI